MTQKFKDNMMTTGRGVRKIWTHNGVDYEDDFIKFKRSIDGSLFSSVMKMMEIDLLGKHDLIDEDIRVRFGVDKHDGDYSWKYEGLYTVTDIEDSDDRDVTSLVGYDRMIRMHKEYNSEDMNLSYPTTVGTILKRICVIRDVTLGTPTFDAHDFVVDMDKWANVGEITYRTILDEIAQLSASTILFVDDVLHVVKPKQTSETIDESNLRKLKVGNPFGPINILNLAREPQHDNVSKPDNWQTIPIDDRKEVVFADNSLLDSNREMHIGSLFNRVKSLNYTPFSADSFGYGWYAFGDLVTVRDKIGKTYLSMITKSVLTVSNGIVEEIGSEEPRYIKQKYVLDSDVARQGARVAFIVDKQNLTIQGIIEKTDDMVDQQANFEIRLDSITETVSSINNNANIIPNFNGNLEKVVDPNTGGYVYPFWTFEQSGLLPADDLYPSNDLYPADKDSAIFWQELLKGSLSKWGLRFDAKGSAISGEGYVVPDEVHSIRLKRYTGTQRFKIYLREFEESKATEFTEKLILDTSNPKTYEEATTTLLPTTQYVRVRFETLDASTLTLTEMMFNRGAPKPFNESAEDVKLFAETRFEMLDDSIELSNQKVVGLETELTQNTIRLEDSIYFQSQKINGLSDDIHNTKVNIDAMSGVTIQASDSSALTVKNIQNKTVFSLNTNGDIVMNDITANDATFNNANITGNLNAGKIAGLLFNNNKISFPNGQLALNSANNSIDFGEMKLKFLRKTQQGGQITDEAVFSTPYNSNVLSIQGTVNGAYGGIFDGIRTNTVSSNYFLGTGGNVVVGGLEGHPEILYLNARDIMFAGNITHNGLNPYDIGASTRRFRTVYLANQPNVASDARYKSDIQDIDPFLLDMIAKYVIPKRYETQFDDKIHFGYIAQDVEMAFYQYFYQSSVLNGMNKLEASRFANTQIAQFAVLSKSDSYMSLLYGEISVIIDAYNRKRMNDLEERLLRLENGV